MKKTWVFYFVFLFVCVSYISIASAAEIQFINQDNTNSFAQGETLIARSSINFIENPTASNIKFYRGTVEIPVSFQSEMIGDDIYIYASLKDKTTGNYSISIKDTKYMDGANEVQGDVTKNFTIGDNIADFSVSPGFVKNTTAFKIEVQNLQSDPITLSTSTSDNLLPTGSTSLRSGEIKQITFQPSGNSNSFSDEIIMTSSLGNTEYTIPVFFNTSSSTITSTGGNGSQSSTSGDESLSFSPSVVALSLATDSDAKRTIYLKNTGDVDLNNLEFFISDNLKQYVTIVSEKQDLASGSTSKIDLTINSDSTEKVLDGQITVEANDGNVSSSLRLVANFVRDYVPSTNETNSGGIVTTCADLNGVICDQNTEQCSGDTAQVKDGICCLSQCTPIQKSSTGKIIGWAIIVFVVLFLLWFLKRYRRVRPQIIMPKSRGFFGR